MVNSIGVSYWVYRIVEPIVAPTAFRFFWGIAIDHAGGGLKLRRMALLPRAEWSGAESESAGRSRSFSLPLTLHYIYIYDMTDIYIHTYIHPYLVLKYGLQSLNMYGIHMYLP